MLLYLHTSIYKLVFCGNMQNTLYQRNYFTCSWGKETFFVIFFTLAVFTTPLLTRHTLDRAVLWNFLAYFTEPMSCRKFSGHFTPCCFCLKLPGDFKNLLFSSWLLEVQTCKERTLVQLPSETLWACVSS